MNKISSFPLDSIANGVAGGDGSEVSTAACDSARRSADSETAPAIFHPLTNRGVEFGLHWLTVTFFFERGKKIEACVGTYDETPKKKSPMVLGVEALKRIWGGAFGAEKEYDDSKVGGRGFDSIQIGVYEHKIYSYHRTSKRPCISVELPGTYCEMVGTRRLLDLVRQSIKESGAIEFQGTRIDSAFDTVLFLPRDAWQACKDGAIRSLVKRECRVVNDKVVSSILFQEGLSDRCQTLSIGSRQSERYLRAYARESGQGRLAGKACTRVELECKGDRAADVLNAYLSANETFLPMLAMGILRDYVDFKTAWWDQFIDAAPRAGMTLSGDMTPCHKADKAWRWMVAQVMPTLSALIAGADGRMGCLHDALYAGRHRWNDRHRRMISELLDAPLYEYQTHAKLR